MIRAFNHKHFSRRNYRPFVPFLYSVENQLGAIKVYILVLLPIVCLTGLWIYIFANNLSLDYKLHTLKQKVSTLEEQYASLQEELSQINSLGSIQRWAEENDFVEITKVGYLDLSNTNVAQVINPRQF